MDNLHAYARTTDESSVPARKRLLGKVAIITGGASGIGEATCRKFVEEGAIVIIGDIQDDMGTRIMAELASNCYYKHCDVSNEDDVSSIVDFAMERFHRLDVMVNNAGIGGSPNPTTNQDVATFDKIMSVNVKGVFLGLKHAARVMIPMKSGCIISTASTASVLGGLANPAYTASKHALLGLTKSVAVELGQHGIRVNCVSPHGIPTPLVVQLMQETFGLAKGTCTRQVVQTWLDDKCSNLRGTSLVEDDVAQAILFLANEEAKYVSGHNLVLDGGFTIGKTLQL